MSAPTNTLYTTGYNDKGERVLTAARTSFDPSTDHRIAECALMFREAVVERKQTNINPLVLWKHIMGSEWSPAMPKLPTILGLYPDTRDVARAYAKEFALAFAGVPVPVKLPVPPAQAEASDVIYAEGWNACCDAFFGGKPAPEALVIEIGTTPIDMLLYCPNCGVQHIDKDNSDELRIQAAELGIDREGDRRCERWIEEREWTNPPHRSHLCASCGCIWRPADVPTNGVEAVATHGTADSWVAASPDAARALVVRHIDGSANVVGVPEATPLTATALADALDHFWNAAIGASHNEQSTVSCIAQGIDAVARELRK